MKASSKMVSRKVVWLTLFVQLISISIDALSSADSNITSLGCGKVKGCLFKPDDCTPFLNCEYFMSYAPFRDNNEGAVKIDLLAQSSRSGDQYVSVGFSDDQKMGNEPVTYCMYVETGAPRIGLGQNPGGHIRTVLSSSPQTQNQVRLLGSGLLNNHFWCTFLQKVAPTFSAPDLRNLDSDYHILLAAGGAIAAENTIGIHPTGSSTKGFPYISGSKVNLNRAFFTEIQTETRCVSVVTAKRLIKSHGILMLIGWWVYVAIAILWARYFHSLFPDGKLCGSPYWFFFHRTLNFIGVTLIAAAFICIFIAACGEWTNSDHAYNHSVLGMTASVCAFVQPLLSFVRCNPGHSKRFIFNWVHRIIGIAALGCACAAIWFATHFKETGLHYDDGYGHAPRGMIIFYYASLVAAFLLLEFFITLVERFRRDDAVADAAAATSNQMKMEPQRESSRGFFKTAIWNMLRLGILGLFVVIAIAVVITLACFIGLA